MRTSEIAQRYTGYFEKHGHLVVPSASLISPNPTTLFTIAGMVPFVPYLLGEQSPPSKRITSNQKCVRTLDIDEVGKTTRHGTFFQMLGNFSFGDYFKEEAIHYAWELLTTPQDQGGYGFDVEKLWVTTFTDDEEARAIWRNEGMDPEHMQVMGMEDNFWTMGGPGPGGPCSEIYVDRGPQYGKEGGPIADEDRYTEIWDLVFENYEVDNVKSKTDLHIVGELAHKNIDTGMGLERIAAVLQHVNSNYDIDLFRTLIAATAKVTGATDLSSKSLRVIADHIRSCAFLVSDGVLPSNEGRGYVLRRIIRRAVRHGNMVGAKETFFYKLVAPLIEVMGPAADELKRQQSMVEQVLKTEEEQFARTLERGLALLDDELSKLSGDTLDGETAFRLYDTYGFPLDLTADVCRERNLKVDEIGFERAMEEQRRRARESSGFGADYNSMIRVDGASKFSGYDHNQQHSSVTALFRDGQAVDVLNAGEEGVVVLNETPFYAESGGQVGDKGELTAQGVSFVVTDTQKYGQAIGHQGKVAQGSVKVGDSVEATIDEARRSRIRLNHSATHLLHAALRQVLGDHVSQKGSLVSDRNLRFDFSHFEAMKPEQIRQVEDIVNAQIRRNLPIETNIMDLEDAKAKGAMALFGEKYDESVRVLSMGDFSTELCGGTHARQTGDIGLFRITSEAGTAAGVRRIEAVTGEGAIAVMHQDADALREAASLVKSDAHSVAEKIRAVMDKTRQLEKELQQLKDQQAAQESASLSSKAVDVKGVKLLVSQLDNVEAKMLRTMVDDLKNQLGSGVVVLATTAEGKVSLVAGVTKDLTDKVKAGELIGMVAQQVGGKGGGRPDMAMAGGSDATALPQALAGVEAWVADKL